MPGRNLIKQYADDSYYHIYNRGVNKQPIFKDDQDYRVFTNLLKRYLGSQTEKAQNRVNHPNYFYDIELLAYCLMTNHFHLFIYQTKGDSITKFMRSLTTAYSMYFNKKYKRIGPVFQQRYRAVRITKDSQLLHISRYIHLNPADYKNYKWSSYDCYVNNVYPEGEWLRPLKITSLFDDYKKFVDDYKDYHDELEQLKSELADG